jgi:hypothetical protein
MNSWFKVTVPFEEAGVAGTAKKLQDAFYVLFVMNGSPPNAAIFGLRSDNQYHYCVYFSPGAARIAGSVIEHYSGVPCERPPRNAALLVGHAGARESLLE